MLVWLASLSVGKCPLSQYETVAGFLAQQLCPQVTPAASFSCLSVHATSSAQASATAALTSVPPAAAARGPVPLTGMGVDLRAETCSPS